MRERLLIPADRDGYLFRYTARPRGGFHRHDELEWNLVVRGTARYLVGERRYDLRRHHLIWLLPDQEHVLVDPSPDCELWVVVVRGAALSRIAGSTVDTRLLARNSPMLLSRPLPSADSNRLDDALSHLAGIDDHHVFNAGLGFATLDAWRSFLAADGESDHAAVDPVVDLAARLLSRNDAPDSLADLATRVGLSPSRLSRKFHAQLGVTLVDYRNRARLERFLGRYHPDGRESVLEAALAAGFGSYPQFHRVFLQILGRSPRAYFAVSESR